MVLKCLHVVFYDFKKRNQNMEKLIPNVLHVDVPVFANKNGL